MAGIMLPAPEWDRKDQVEACRGCITVWLGWFLPSFSFFSAPTCKIGLVWPSQDRHSELSASPRWRLPLVSPLWKRKPSGWKQATRYLMAETKKNPRVLTHGLVAPRPPALFAAFHGPPGAQSAFRAPFCLCLCSPTLPELTSKLYNPDCFLWEPGHNMTLHPQVKFAWYHLVLIRSSPSSVSPSGDGDRHWGGQRPTSAEAKEILQYCKEARSSPPNFFLSSYRRNPSSSLYRGGQKHFRSQKKVLHEAWNTRMEFFITSRRCPAWQSWCLFPAFRIARCPPSQLLIGRCLSHFALLQGTGPRLSKVVDYRCFQCLQETGSNGCGPSAGSLLPASGGNLSQGHVYRQWLHLLLVPHHLLFHVTSISSGSGVTWQSKIVLSHMFSLCAHFLPCLSISFLL